MEVSERLTLCRQLILAAFNIMQSKYKQLNVKSEDFEWFQKTFPKNGDIKQWAGFRAMRHLWEKKYKKKEAGKLE